MEAAQNAISLVSSRNFSTGGNTPTGQLAGKAGAKADLGWCSESRQARQEARIATSHQELRRSGMIQGMAAALDMIFSEPARRHSFSILKLLTRFHLLPQCFRQHGKFNWLYAPGDTSIDMRFEFTAVTGCKYKRDLF